MILTGKIIEIGDLKHLDDYIQGSPHPSSLAGMVVLITRAQLEAVDENLLYAKVKIELVKE